MSTATSPPFTKTLAARFDAVKPAPFQYLPVMLFFAMLYDISVPLFACLVIPIIRKRLDIAIGKEKYI